jgi:hypothetical protein
MGALSELEAVNFILRLAMEHPVQSLTTATGDSIIALQMLEEANRTEQAEGRYYNTEEYEAAIDSDGFISVSDNTLHVDTVPPDDDVSVVPRGKSPTKLYDLVNRTFVFDQNICIRIAVLQDFEDIPTPAQYRVMARAARDYQLITLGDSQLDGRIREIMAEFRAKERADDMRQADANIFYTFKSPNARRAGRYTTRDWGRIF